MKYHLTLNLPPQSKLRPVVTRNGAYHKPKYVNWLNQAVIQLDQLWNLPPLEAIDKIEIIYHSNLKGGDLDNCCGAVFDALTKAQVWIDDRIVNHLEVKRVSILKKEKSRIEVIIYGYQQKQGLQAKNGNRKIVCKKDTKAEDRNGNTRTGRSDVRAALKVQAPS